VNITYEPIEEFIQEHPISVYGADMEGTPLQTMDFETPSLVILGSESHGLSEHLHKLLTKTIAIKQYGHAESLNVGIAAGIIAHHLRMAM
jgi:TrmH family RNA methyltransferase